MNYQLPDNKQGVRGTHKNQKNNMEVREQDKPDSEMRRDFGPKKKVMGMLTDS